jgi:DNA polymerase delta subunit 4
MHVYICSDSGGYTAEEEELRQFDMDMSYGPSIGVTRLRRWERAAAMGLRPPPHLRDLILRQQHHGGGGASAPQPKSKSDGRNGDDVVSQLECLWAGKV